MLFNSLGSNYDAGFVIRSLLAMPGKRDENKLVRYLEKRYNGNVKLLYKGREAIKLALKIMDLPGNSKVGVTGFTCYVVVQAILEAGYIPEYIDVNRNDLNFTAEEIKKHKSIRALIVQNTLGNPSEIAEISAYCRKHSVYLIEDLAHSIGTIYKNGRQAGTVGDFVALSFSQDKSVDAISGGALVIRNRSFKFNDSQYLMKEVQVSQRIKDRLYPLLTAMIRVTYVIGIGKFLHLVLKKFNLLTKPVLGDGAIEFHKLPYLNCRLAYEQYMRLNDVLNHRKKISSIYHQKFGGHMKGTIRWPLIVRNRKEFIGIMKNKGVFISDTWYDAPVAPVALLAKSGYVSKTCPNAEYIAAHLVNLPTHINVTVDEAEKIAENVKPWLNLNK